MFWVGVFAAQAREREVAGRVGVGTWAAQMEAGREAGLEVKGWLAYLSTVTLLVLIQTKWQDIRKCRSKKGF